MLTSTFVYYAVSSNTYSKNSSYFVLLYVGFSSADGSAIPLKTGRGLNLFGVVRQRIGVEYVVCEVLAGYICCVLEGSICCEVKAWG